MAGSGVQQGEDQRADKDTHQDLNIRTTTSGPQHQDHNIRTSTSGPQHQDHSIRTSTSGPQHQDLNIRTSAAVPYMRTGRIITTGRLHTHFNCKDLHFCPHHVLCSKGLKWTPHLSIKHGGAAVETRVRRVPEIM